MVFDAVQADTRTAPVATSSAGLSTAAGFEQIEPAKGTAESVADGMTAPAADGMV
jgi:hypothetical protein